MFYRKKVVKESKIKVPPTKCLVRSVKNIDWTDFEKHILDFQFNLTENELHTDREVIRFNNYVMCKLDLIAPLRQRLIKRKRCQWFNNDIKLLCNNRNKLREEAKLNNDWKSYRVEKIMFYMNYRKPSVNILRKNSVRS